MSPTSIIATVIILFDPGGLVSEYELKAAHINATKTQVQILGDCYSACTILADRAREHVCVGPAARMFIHQATLHPSGRREPVQ